MLSYPEPVTAEVRRMRRPRGTSLRALSGALILEEIAERLGEHGAQLNMLQSEGAAGVDAIVATFGDPSVPGYLLYAHLDLAAPGGQPMAARATTARDDNGFVAALLAAAPALAQMDLAAPLHLVIGQDAIGGAKAVAQVLAALPRLAAHPLGAIIGAPTGLVPVLSHPGRAVLRLRARSGPARHDSVTGTDPVHALVPALAAAVVADEGLSRRRSDGASPSIRVSSVIGGTAAEASAPEALIEARSDGVTDLAALLAPVAAAAAPSLAVDWLMDARALSLGADHPLARLAVRLSGTDPHESDSQLFSQAGRFQQAGIPALVCGPGLPGDANLDQDDADAATALILKLAGGLAAS